MFSMKTVESNWSLLRMYWMNTYVHMTRHVRHSLAGVDTAKLVAIACKAFCFKVSESNQSVRQTACIATKFYQIHMPYSMCHVSLLYCRSRRHSLSLKHPPPEGLNWPMSWVQKVPAVESQQQSSGVISCTSRLHIDPSICWYLLTSTSD